MAEDLTGQRQCAATADACAAGRIHAGAAWCPGHERDIAEVAVAFPQWRRTTPMRSAGPRRTYEIFAAHWPYISDNPIADRLNAMTKYVASRTLKEVT